MKLSLRGEYALRALIVLGLNHHRPVVRVKAISELQNIPKRFLEQILYELKDIGFVESQRGLAGGYRLKVPPEEITLAEVIRRVEGPLAPVSCVSERFYERCSCPDVVNCPIRSVMQEVRDAIVKILESVTLAEVCERARKLQGQPASPLDYVI